MICLGFNSTILSHTINSLPAQFTIISTFLPGGPLLIWNGNKEDLSAKLSLLSYVTLFLKIICSILFAYKNKQKRLIIIDM
jgi:hypothetical protein